MFSELDDKTILSLDEIIKKIDNKNQKNITNIILKLSDEKVLRKNNVLSSVPRVSSVDTLIKYSTTYRVSELLRDSKNNKIKYFFEKIFFPIIIPIIVSIITSLLVAALK